MKSFISMLRTLPLIMLLSACSILSQAPLRAVYDLGPPPAISSGSPPTVFVKVGSVTEPESLSTTDIHYRLLYDDPQQLRSYADSQWAGSAGELIQGRVESALPDVWMTSPSHSIQYILDLQVQTFEQVFSSPTSAYDDLQVRVVLRATPDNRVIAEHLFSFRQPCALNARGVADGLSALTDQFTASLLKWIPSSTTIN